MASTGTLAVAGCSGDGGDGGGSGDDGTSGGDGGGDGGGSGDDGTSGGGSGDGGSGDGSGSTQEREWHPYYLFSGTSITWDLTVNEVESWIDSVQFSAEPGHTGTFSAEATLEGESLIHNYELEYNGTTKTETFEHGPNVPTASLQVHMDGWNWLIGRTLANSLTLGDAEMWDAPAGRSSGFELSEGTSLTTGAGAQGSDNPNPAVELTTEVAGQESHGGYDCWMVEESNYYVTYHRACVTRDVSMPVYGEFLGQRGAREVPDTPKATMTMTNYEES